MNCGIIPKNREGGKHKELSHFKERILLLAPVTDLKH